MPARQSFRLVAIVAFFAVDAVAVTTGSLSIPTTTPDACPFDPSANTNLAVYYGQGTNQPRLRHFCEDSNIDIIPIGFVNEFPDAPGKYPGSNFGNQCSDETATNEDGSQSDFLTMCPNLAIDIPICQALGKKILVSLGGAIPNNQKLGSEEIAQSFGDFLWRAFGPNKEAPNSPFPRPFGNAVVDGFDLDIESISTADNGVSEQDLFLGYGTLVERLRQRYSEAEGDFYISGAPQCVVPDVHLAEAIEQQDFDFLFIRFYNTPQCSARAWVDDREGDNGFTFDQWVDYVRQFSPTTKLFLGLPGSTDAVDDPQYYLNVADGKQITQFFQGQYPAEFGGIMIYEATTSELNDNYADKLKQNIMNTDVATEDCIIPIVPSSIIPSSIVPSSIISSSIVPSSIVPSGIVPSGIISSSIVPSGIVPSGIIPSAIVSSGSSSAPAITLTRPLNSLRPTGTGALPVVIGTSLTGAGIFPTGSGTNPVRSPITVASASTSLHRIDTGIHPVGSAVSMGASPLPSESVRSYLGGGGSRPASSGLTAPSEPVPTSGSAYNPSFSSNPLGSIRPPGSLRPSGFLSFQGSQTGTTITSPPGTGVTASRGTPSSQRIQPGSSSGISVLPVVSSSQASRDTQTGTNVPPLQVTQPGVPGSMVSLPFVASSGSDHLSSQGTQLSTTVISHPGTAMSFSDDTQSSTNVLSPQRTESGSPGSGASMPPLVLSSRASEAFSSASSTFLGNNSIQATSKRSNTTYSNENLLATTTSAGNTGAVVTAVITTSYTTTYPATHTLTSSGKQVIQTGVTTSIVFEIITSTISTGFSPLATPAPTTPVHEVFTTVITSIRVTAFPVTQTAAFNGVPVAATMVTVSTVTETMISLVTSGVRVSSLAKAIPPTEQGQGQFPSASIPLASNIPGSGGDSAPGSRNGPEDNAQGRKDRLPNTRQQMVKYRPGMVNNLANEPDNVAASKPITSESLKDMAVQRPEPGKVGTNANGLPVDNKGQILSNTPASQANNEGAGQVHSLFPPISTPPTHQDQGQGQYTPGSSVTGSTVPGANHNAQGSKNASGSHFPAQGQRAPDCNASSRLQTACKKNATGAGSIAGPQAEFAEKGSKTLLLEPTIIPETKSPMLKTSRPTSARAYPVPLRGNGNANLAASVGTNGNLSAGSDQPLPSGIATFTGAASGASGGVFGVTIALLASLVIL